MIAAVVCNTIPVARRPLQALVTAANLVGITVPNFMLGVSLIFVLSVKLNLLPSTGWVPWSDGIGVHLRHMIMPVLTLSAYYFGAFSIVYRAEYARTSSSASSSAWPMPRDWASGAWRSVMRRRTPSCR